MEKIKQIESLPFIQDYKKKLRKKDYSNSTVIAIETAKLFREIIKTKSLWSTFTELLKILRTLGKGLINVDPLQFSLGNIIKRVKTYKLDPLYSQR
jgi:translation initiation factor 2B subunit (eIF-2B alpha/beta/delta family)